MFVLGLITCVALTAFNAQAKVVDSFNECKGFFYKGIEPSGMDQNAKKICQKLENGRFYYATLYSVYHRIPLYSAYILDPACSRDKIRTDIWHLEPQISQSTSQIYHMVREDQNTQNLYRGNQAISSDYSNTGYDRGHLNPSSFQCSDGRTATFTLTNAAPMKERFNRVHWNRWERMLRSSLRDKLVSDFGFATAYIVTGTVPDRSVRIPHTRRVTVPSHIWTAVCYKHSTDDRKTFSLGCIGRNQQKEPDIRLMSVSELNNELRLHFGTNQQIKIFIDNCFVNSFDDNDELNNFLEAFQEIIDLVNLAVEKSSRINDTDLVVKRTFNSDGTLEKKVKVNANAGKIAFDSMSSYYKVAEYLKGLEEPPCLIISVKSQVRKMDDELRKREVPAGPDAVECQGVNAFKYTAADGSRSECFTKSDYSCQCKTGKESKPCCSTPCFYQDDLKGYRCYSDQKLIECSPAYSLITYNGKRCLDDYPCATNGVDYYWCKTRRGYIKDDWDYCSPPLWNSKAKNGKYCLSNYACAKYGENQPWCYTDDKGNKEKCCISDDCHSAVDGQTCRSDHPCGYHGYKYLWCYTDDKNNWDYCCTDCSR
ncbi:uncharacterized protein [Garra rufa]|uniref:uncharacterized protein n=1 Tax=Garra rufa TaxID=137080 RepID=UPI003CCE9A77